MSKIPITRLEAIEVIKNLPIMEPKPKPKDPKPKE